MPLVAGAGLAHVEVADPVTLRLDVNAAPDQDARLRLGVRLEEEWYGASRPRRARRGRSRGGALAGRGRRLGGDAGGADRAGRPRGAPPAQARRLGGGARRGPRGPDRGLPAAAAPARPGDLLRRVGRGAGDRRAAAGARRSPGWRPTRSRVAWTWRYRVGGDDRVYRLSETRGLRGVRRPEDEQALLDALVLDDEQVLPPVPRAAARPRARGRQVPSATRTRSLFAEQLLPGLRGQVEIEEIGDQPRLPGDRRRLPVGRTSRPARSPGTTRDPHRLARPRGGGHRRRHPDRAGARARGADQGDGPGHPAQRHSTCASTGPSSPTWPGWSEAAAELVDQPDGAVRVGHHDLGLWDELAEVGIVDEQAAQWVRSAQALRTLDTLPDGRPGRA